MGTLPAAEPEVFVTEPILIKAFNCSSVSVKPVVTPEATTAVICAVCPTSVKSTSLKLAVMLLVRLLVVVCSFRLVCAMVAITGASFVPVIEIVTSSLSLPPFPSDTVIVNVAFTFSSFAKKSSAVSETV